MYLVTFFVRRASGEIQSVTDYILFRTREEAEKRAKDKNMYGYEAVVGYCIDHLIVAE